MIRRRLLAAIRTARIAHHQRRADMFGAACVTAQMRGDTRNGAFFLRQMHAAQAKRDALIARQGPANEREPKPHAGGCPPCNHHCDEGRSCPARSR